MVTMKLRYPKISANICSSGKITVSGAHSYEDAKKGARRIARILQNLGFKVKFTDFRVINVLGNVDCPFGIKISQFTEHYREVCRYASSSNPLPGRYRTFSRQRNPVHVIFCYS